MKIVSVGYARSNDFNAPSAWLEKIGFYTCILESLAVKHEVNSIEQICYSGRVLQNGVWYHFIQAGDLISILPFRLHRYIRKLEPAVVLVNGFITPLQLIQLKWMLGRRSRILVINRAEKPGRGIRRLLQRSADHYIYKYLFTSAEMGMPWVKEGIIRHESKIAGIIGASSNFVATHKVLARERTGVHGSPVFLFVGRLDANKDPLTILRAFRNYAVEQAAARLYMIYQAEELLGEINELIGQDIYLQRSVVLVGEIAHHAMDQWYSSADFIISGSHYEGSGIAVCEAMSCGCIPILTNIPSFRAMSGNGNCGFLYEPGDAGALLKILLQTGTRDLQAEKERTLQQFREELSFETIAAKIDHIITEGQ